MSRSFNGSSDLVVADAAHVGSLASPWSMSCWLFCAAGVTDADFYGESRSSSNNPFIQLQCHSGKFRLFMRRDSNSGTSDVNGSVGTLTLADSTWRHFVYTQDGANTQTYVDGVADLSLTHGTAAMTIDRVTFGALRRSTTTNFWAGRLQDVANWSRQLSAGEAKALASGMCASLLGPDHYWRLYGDSPEADIGLAATKVAGTLTGTSIVGGGRAGISPLTLAAR